MTSLFALTSSVLSVYPPGTFPMKNSFLTADLGNLTDFLSFPSNHICSFFPFFTNFNECHAPSATLIGKVTGQFLGIFLLPFIWNVNRPSFSSRNLYWFAALLPYKWKMRLLICVVLGELLTVDKKSNPLESRVLNSNSNLKSFFQNWVLIFK